MREYDLIAAWYASSRRGPIGVPEALELARVLAPDARILDLGCGTAARFSSAAIASWDSTAPRGCWRSFAPTALRRQR